LQSMYVCAAHRRGPLPRMRLSRIRHSVGQQPLASTRKRVRKAPGFDQGRRRISQNVVGRIKGSLQLDGLATSASTAPGERGGLAPPKEEEDGTLTRTRHRDRPTKKASNPWTWEDVVHKNSGSGRGRNAAQRTCQAEAQAPGGQTPAANTFRLHGQPLRHSRGATGCAVAGGHSAFPHRRAHPLSRWTAPVFVQGHFIQRRRFSILASCKLTTLPVIPHAQRD